MRQNFKRVQFQRRKHETAPKWPHVESNPCFCRANKFAHLMVRGTDGGEKRGGERRDVNLQVRKVDNSRGMLTWRNAARRTRCINMDDT